jgi:hypothetical protein
MSIDGPRHHNATKASIVCGHGIIIECPSNVFLCRVRKIISIQNTTHLTNKLPFFWPRDVIVIHISSLPSTVQSNFHILSSCYREASDISFTTPSTMGSQKRGSKKKEISSHNSIYLLRLQQQQHNKKILNRATISNHKSTMTEYFPSVCTSHDVVDIEDPSCVLKDSVVEKKDNEEQQQQNNDDRLFTETHGKTRARHHLLYMVTVGVFLVVTAIVALAFHAQDRPPTVAMLNMAKEYQLPLLTPSQQQRSLTKEATLLQSHQTGRSHIKGGGRSMLPAADEKVCIEYRQSAIGVDLVATRAQCLVQVNDQGCVDGVPYFIREYQVQADWYVICDCECGE